MIRRIINITYPKECAVVLHAEWKILLLTILIFITSHQEARAYSPDDATEISLTVNVLHVGSAELPAVVSGQSTYLAIKDLFDFLRVQCSITSNLDTVSGIFPDHAASFIIDKSNNLIRFDGKVFQLPDTDLIKTETNLYLKTNYFGNVFGLYCSFDFRSLSVTLNSKIELPAIRELRLEEQHERLGNKNNNPAADTCIHSAFSLMHFGMADWLILGTQEASGFKQVRMNLGLGATLFGGDASASLNYNTGTPFTEKQQYYLWRYANNNLKAFRQLMIGKIFTQPISTIYDPVIGVQLTNTPTYYRRAFDTYTLSDYTKPNWMVELYMNNELVDYTTADASGFFTFQVPQVYGTTDITLRYYGPYGEEKISRRSITVPFGFLPPGELEYRLSAGLVEDDKNSRFAQARLNYGLSRSLAVSGGWEYVSTFNKPDLPFLVTAFRMPYNFILTLEYVYGVKSSEVLTYHSPSNLQLELSYTRYVPGQEAVKYNYTEEAKAMASMPFHLGKISGFSRLSFNRNVLPTVRASNGEFLLSCGYRQFNANITTDAYLLNNETPTVYSDVSLSWSFRGGLILTTRMQYDYTNGRFLTVRQGAEKRIWNRGFANASYEYNVASGFSTWQFGFRYDFNFAHVGSLVTRSKNYTAVNESASGSLIYDQQTNYFSAAGNSNLGRGGLIFVAFLDVNDNGIRDKDEPKVDGLSIQVNNGTVSRDRRDSTIVVTGLEGYTNCFATLSTNALEYVAWRIEHHTLNIAVTPNQLRLVEIPVKVVGEVTGTISVAEPDAWPSGEKIRVNIFRTDSILVATVIADNEGNFDYLGLAPGTYKAEAERTQLDKHHLAADAVWFRIQPSVEGDVIDDLQIVIKGD